ncbi:leucyl/phenylalanyl-tRNA--protein transferase [Thermodesulforhabdus norvegica]|uniref:Leucyl/phenylalanyl-tRNA--protein transferase n=1 Tax=Thermodesulforhabdus norvegica TaxID=39841 RepID=A0A1I4VQC7_9BACT|nr:leucyl/phenylalanyl-tRNA--protein transferase [Thermodesulforhabdus norvegica]SFN03468.1 leucyl/phenylalanyl-tRNA--protein transferase [Thermodesulforhabdus norvegica]
MTVFRLTEELIFPHPELADEDGLLAVGGDLSPARLLLAYSAGIFPWYDESTPILWWSPDPRLILLPRDIKISHSLRRVLKKGRFRVSFDQAFHRVIRECAAVRVEKGLQTWLIPEMIEAYERLHELGFAHSVETWMEGKLVGGLYGVSLGRAFFGESMFSREKDASKVALVILAMVLQSWNFHFIDCQLPSDHLKRMGAVEVPRAKFLEMLREALKHPTYRGRWEPTVEAIQRIYLTPRSEKPVKTERS